MGDGYGIGAPTLSARLTSLAGHASRSAESALRGVRERAAEVGDSVGLFRRSINVGVVGLYQSGKTTFLTSLVSHLSRYDPEQFHLGRGVEVGPLRTLEAEEGFKRFNAEAHRARLAKDGRWPEKTSVVSQYRADVDLSGSVSKRARLTLLDCPGERMADLPMAGRSYAEWSDWMLEQMRVSSNVPHARGFLEFVDAASTSDSDAFVRSYKESLARLALAYTPIVSPSYFVLDEEGHEIEPGQRTVEAMVSARFVGLGAEREFAPMSVAHRTARPELARTYEAHYDAYRMQAVARLARWLDGCQHLVVLVDLSMILSGGLGMLRAHGALIDQIVEQTTPGFGDVGEIVRRVTGAVGRPLPGVRKITFVATKSDKFHPEDRVRLDGLLRQLVREPVRRHALAAKHLDLEYMIVSAVRSTDATTDGALVATLPGGGGEAAFRVSRVPERWPEDKWGEYRFTAVEPKFPANEMYAPDHTGMHLVARSILGLGKPGGGSR